ncbi:MAG: Vacuolar protein sorting-associated protein 62 [Trizodia sp. TS-e1964]|nr:MAG: Vacuolar protein sorting-associated protein 62 [Trizodia sp. TS-e1964]
MIMDSELWKLSQMAAIVRYHQSSPAPAPFRFLGSNPGVYPPQSPLINVSPTEQAPLSTTFPSADQLTSGLPSLTIQHSKPASYPVEPDADNIYVLETGQRPASPASHEYSNRYFTGIVQPFSRFFRWHKCNEPDSYSSELGQQLDPPPASCSPSHYRRVISKYASDWLNNLWPSNYGNKSIYSTILSTCDLLAKGLFKKLPLKSFENPAENMHESTEIPQYVLDYAPLVHLFSGEQFWPCDIADHLMHTTPYLNYTPLEGRHSHPELSNLDELNRFGGRNVYLQSNDNVEERPEWLSGRKNIPLPIASAEPKLSQADWPTMNLHRKQRQNTMRRPADNTGDKKTTHNANGRSNAPAVLVVVDKGYGTVDAFWFYFYSYNLGNLVFNIRFGNHVGDWEHSLVRFRYGVPQAVYFSEHSWGDSYTYDAVEKIGKRPVVYSATGTHAMYATPGIQSYVLPFGLLHDQTDRGPLWDPLLNSHTYTYDNHTGVLRASDLTPDSPTEWFYFTGHWGDKVYPLSDRRQYEFAGQYHYGSGPTGPRAKNLGRVNVCQGDDQLCPIKDSLNAGQIRKWGGMPVEDDIKT